jgi:hypothetical protein
LALDDLRALEGELRSDIGFGDLICCQRFQSDPAKYEDQVLAADAAREISRDDS